MSNKKLWTKFYRNINIEDEMALHSAGATVRHRNPFEDIEVPRPEEELTEEFIKKWIVPFYMTSLSNADDETILKFAAAAAEADQDIVFKLLSEFDWRPRITGAFFSAINNYHEFEDIIGRHLLKSEVCYAGSGYCLALATFGSDNAKKYLFTYLNYYLDRKDLWFDQTDAFCALDYLDKEAAAKLLNKWNSFIEDRNHVNLDESKACFRQEMQVLGKIRNTRHLIR